MRIALLAAALAVVASPVVYGTHKPSPPPPPPAPHAISSSDSSATSIAGAAADSSATSGSTSSVTNDITLTPTVIANPSAAATASNDGVHTSTDQAVTITAPRNAPSLAQGSLVPSGCGAGANGGGSNTHGAGFLGITWTTDECYLFLLGEKFAAIGMPDTACDIWMRTKASDRAFRGKVKPACTIGRPSAPSTDPTRMTIEMVGPPIAVLPVATPAAAAPIECTPPPASSASRATRRKPKPAIEATCKP